MTQQQQQHHELITVIIPVYNAEPFLRQALASIVGQSYRNLEILCLNDGSTDGSAAILAEFARQDERIRIIDKPNEGYGATCNRGLAEARGSWIAVLEPDDWIEGPMFERMIAFASTLDTMPDIVKSPYWRIVSPDTNQEQRLPCAYAGTFRVRKQPFSVDKAPHLLDSHPSIWSALYRKEFLDRCGIRFKEYPGAGWADNPFLIETLCQTTKIAYIDQAFYCYREDTPEKTAEFTRRFPERPLQRWNEMRDILDRLDAGGNPIIVEAHNRRGVFYVDVILREIEAPDEHLSSAIASTLRRMEPNLVLADPYLPADLRRLYARYAGLPEPRINKGCDRFKLALLDMRRRGIVATVRALTHRR